MPHPRRCLVLLGGAACLAPRAAGAAEPRPHPRGAAGPPPGGAPPPRDPATGIFAPRTNQPGAGGPGRGQDRATGIFAPRVTGTPGADGAAPGPAPAAAP